MPGKNILVLSSGNLKGPIIWVNRIHINSWEGVCPNQKIPPHFGVGTSSALPWPPLSLPRPNSALSAVALRARIHWWAVLSKDLTPVSITLQEFISVPIPFSIELLSKSTFEAPNFILFFGFIYRSRSIRSGAVERIFLAHLVWFGLVLFFFASVFGSGICGFVGVVRTRRREENWFCREKAEKWRQLRRLCVFRLSSLRWGDVALDQHVRVAPRLLNLRLLLQQEWIAPPHPFSHPQVGSSCSCYFSSSSLLRFPWEFVYYDFYVGGWSVGSGRWSGSWRLKEQIPNLIWDQMPMHFRSLRCCQRLDFFRDILNWFSVVLLFNPGFLTLCLLICTHISFFFPSIAKHN